MGHDQPMQFNPEEECVQVPLDLESHQYIDSNHRRNKWLTIIICIILAVTGQSVARLLEIYYILHRNRKYRYGLWTHSLPQVIGFPILLVPFVLILSCNKKKQLVMTSDQISRIPLVIHYPIIAMYMFFQACFYNSKHGIPFRVFTLVYTTQLFFTPVLSPFLYKIRYSLWTITSLVLAIITGSFTLYTFSTDSPEKKQTYKGVLNALSAALFFSLLLCQIRNTFDSIYNVSTNKKQSSFAFVLELIIVSSLLTTLVFIAAVFISGEHHGLKRQMEGSAWTLVGLAVAWQVYWVGIVGLVFAVSAVFSNVISVCAWPIVSLLVAVFYSTYGQYSVLSGIALATAALSVASYLYLIHNDKSDGDDEATI